MPSHTGPGSVTRIGQQLADTIFNLFGALQDDGDSLDNIISSQRGPDRAAMLYAIFLALDRDRNPQSVERAAALKRDHAEDFKQVSLKEKRRLESDVLQLHTQFQLQRIERKVRSLVV